MNLCVCIFLSNNICFLHELQRQLCCLQVWTLMNYQWGTIKKPELGLVIVKREEAVQLLHVQSSHDSPYGSTRLCPQLHSWTVAISLLQYLFLVAQTDPDTTGTKLCLGFLHMAFMSLWNPCITPSPVSVTLLRQAEVSKLVFLRFPYRGGEESDECNILEEIGQCESL